MALRGTVTRLDQFLASLIYLFTLYSLLGCALIWVVYLFVEDKKSPLRSILLHLYPFLRSTFLGGYDAFVSVIVLFGLYIFVVRNRAIQYFVRFHMMQSLVLVTAWPLVLVVAMFSPLSMLFLFVPWLGPGIIILMGLVGLLSIAFVGASVYSLFCAIVGKYGSIPVLSKAVKSHLRL